MNRALTLSLVATAVVLAGGADLPKPVPSVVAPAAATTAGRSSSEVAASVKAVLDTKADPCVDFYRYACGGWLDSTKIPSDRSRWGRGFSEIAERNLAVNREILEQAAKATSPDPDTAKLGALYGSCMNEAAIESAGTKPLAGPLALVKKAKDPASMMEVAASLSTTGVNVLFGGGVDADFKNPNLNILHLGQGGIGLPDRDYYLSDDARKKEIREAYVGHVTKMLQLAGSTTDSAAADAARVLAFETEIAKVSRPREELRDPLKNYNKIDRAGLVKLAPAMAWDKFFTVTGYPNVKDINVSRPDFVTGIEALLKKTDPATMQAYLRWQVVRQNAAVLPKAFVDENFAFYGQKLSGQKELSPRWKRCTQMVDNGLGDLLGKAYVARNFAGDSKAKSLDMIQRVEGAFAAGLPQLAWMDEATRAAAIQKSKMITNKIGYPDKWKDYSTVKLTPGDFFANAQAIQRFDFNREMSKVGKAVDKTEWGMTPPTVNAYYNPLNNEMAFPAGIMQAPFFDRDFSAAMNYGGMGMVMGHELTHGFDDEGRKFAGDGQLREWWAEEVAKKFEERAQCVRDLYSSYEVQPGLKLNGKLTAGENIADLGGIKTAYRAYKSLAAARPDIATVKVEGLSDDQLFFVAFAQTWCTLQTEQVEQQLVLVDPHSHPKYRVNGPVSQLPEFAQAFACQPKTPMNPETRCEVW